jgi:hypothetical protein
VVLMQILSAMTGRVRDGLVSRFLRRFEAGKAPPHLCAIVDLAPNSQIHTRSRALAAERQQEALEAERAKQGGFPGVNMLAEITDATLDAAANAFDAARGPEFNMYGHLNDLVDVLLDSTLYEYEPVAVGALKLLLEVTNLHASVDTGLRGVQLLSSAAAVEYYRALKPLHQRLAQYKLVAIAPADISDVIAAIVEATRLVTHGVTSVATAGATALERHSIACNMRLHTLVAKIISNVPLTSSRPARAHLDLLDAAYRCLEVLLARDGGTTGNAAVVTALSRYMNAFAKHISILPDLVPGVLVRMLRKRSDIATGVTESFIRDVVYGLGETHKRIFGVDTVRAYPKIALILRLLVFQQADGVFASNQAPVLSALSDGGETVLGLLRCRGFFFGHNKTDIVRDLLEAGDHNSDHSMLMLRLELLAVVYHCVKGRDNGTRGEVRSLLFGIGTTTTGISLLVRAVSRTQKYPAFIAQLFVRLLGELTLPDPSLHRALVESPLDAVVAEMVKAVAVCVRAADLDSTEATPAAILSLAGIRTSPPAVPAGVDARCAVGRPELLGAEPLCYHIFVAIAPFLRDITRLLIVGNAEVYANASSSLVTEFQSLAGAMWDLLQRCLRRFPARQYLQSTAEDVALLRAAGLDCTDDLAPGSPMGDDQVPTTTMLLNVSSNAPHAASNALAAGGALVPQTSAEFVVLPETLRSPSTLYHGSGSSIDALPAAVPSRVPLQSLCHLAEAVMSALDRQLLVDAGADAREDVEARVALTRRMFIYHVEQQPSLAALAAADADAKKDTDGGSDVSSASASDGPVKKAALEADRVKNERRRERRADFKAREDALRRGESIDAVTLSERWLAYVDEFAETAEGTVEETAFATTARMMLRKAVLGHSAIRAAVRVLESTYVSDADRYRILLLLRQCLVCEGDALSDASIAIPTVEGGESSIPRELVSSVLTLDKSLDARQDIFAAWPDAASLPPKLLRVVAAGRSSTITAALKCACALLHDGNNEVQQVMFRYFSNVTTEDFFISVRFFLERCRDILHARDRALRRELGAEVLARRGVVEGGVTDNVVSMTTTAAGAQALDGGFGDALEVAVNSNGASGARRAFGPNGESEFVIRNISQNMYRKMDSRYPLDLFVSVLRLSQLMCEGHYRDMQDYFRVQTDNQVSINIIEPMLNVLETLVYAVDRGTYALLQQVLATMIEVVQGPCRGNQEYIIAQNIGGLLTVIMYQEYANLEPEEVHELRFSAITLLLSLLEGHMNRATITTLMQSLELTPFVDVMDTTFAAWKEARGEPIVDNPFASKPGLRYVAVLWDHVRTIYRGLIYGGGDEDEFNDTANLSCSIFIFLKSVLDVQSVDGGESFIDRDGKSVMTLLRLSKTYKKLRPMISTIEVLRNNRVERCYFRVPACCHGNLQASTKKRVIQEVERDNGDGARLMDFFERCFNIMREIDFYDDMRRRRGLSVIYTYAPMLENVSLSLAFAINLVLIVSANFNFMDTESNIDPDGDAYKWYRGLGITLIVVQSILFVNFFFGSLRILLEERWMAWQEDINRDAVRASKETLNVEPPETVDDLRAALPFPVEVAATIYFVFTSPEVYKQVLFLVLSVLGYALAPYYYCIQPLQIIWKFSALNGVVLSITRNAKTLLQTLLLMVTMMNMFVVIMYFLFADKLPSSVGGQGGTCDTMGGCFLTLMVYGMKAGGGIGDEVDPPIYDGTWRPYIYLIYLFLFYIIFPVLLMNLVFGIILDTFGALREERESMEEDQQGKCFICGLEQGELDKIPGGFEQHVAFEHKMWDYLYYMKYLAMKPRDLYTGLEGYVAECVDAHDPRFFPIGRSIAAEYVGRLRSAADDSDEEAATATDERTGDDRDSANSVERLLAELPATVMDALRSEMVAGSLSLTAGAAGGAADGESSPPPAGGRANISSNSRNTSAANNAVNTSVGSVASPATLRPYAQLIPPAPLPLPPNIVGESAAEVAYSAQVAENAQLKKQIARQHEQLSEVGGRLLQLEEALGNVGDRSGKMERLLTEILSSQQAQQQQVQQQLSMISQAVRESSVAASVSAGTAMTTSVDGNARRDSRLDVPRVSSPAFGADMPLPGQVGVSPSRASNPLSHSGEQQ